AYRSRLDSPFAEKNLSQHVGSGYFNFIVADKLPLRVTYLLRHGNSAYFRNIYDVRVDFDAAAFRQRVVGAMKDQLAHRINDLRDSVSEKLYDSSIAQAAKLKQWFEDPFTKQTLYEMNEIARMPSLTYDRNLPDSIARKRSDSLQQLARSFLDTYTTMQHRYERLTHSADSLKKQIAVARERVNTLREFMHGNHKGWRSLQKWKSQLAEFSGNRIELPRRYQWLLGIRNMSLGRTQISHSELTARNLGLNGFNFEYNSWYYFAVTAGLVDYRFRDFSVGPFKKTPQYLFMVRAGVGELERNYLILSAFKGQKQLYASGSLSKGVKPIGVTGLSIEGKWQFARSSYIVAEAAQSFAPALLTDPPATTSFWNLSDHRNKAIAIKLYSFVPKTGSRIEGMYKNTGSNYQSFSSFQTNAAFSSWYIKVDQPFFKRSLKLSAAIRSNEFSNPYIIQNYKSTNVFKTVVLTWSKRRLPSVSIGYIPASQFVRLENALLESRFQTLYANLHHLYKLGNSHTATTIVFNRFYNSAGDSTFTYFNATNIVVGQSFFFKAFNATLNLVQTQNPDYRLNVLDGNIQVPVSRMASFGAGAKINTLNKADLKIGYYGNLQLRMREGDMFFLSFEKNYLNGPKNALVPNDFINVGISKYFK
ncbi:MAG TPA: hypothetical protein VD996_13535, partial [Chitinophagaceae bacterium]|nr:hypothetical protein [Chitinophagaceae bacterium]